MAVQYLLSAAQVAHRSTLMDNVVNALCLYCEERMGKPQSLTDGETTIEFPLCDPCRVKVKESPDPISDEDAKLMLERLKQRGVIDDYIYDLD